MDTSIAHSTAASPFGPFYRTSSELDHDAAMRVEQLVGDFEAMGVDRAKALASLRRVSGRCAMSWQEERDEGLRAARALGLMLLTVAGGAIGSIVAIVAAVLR